MGRATRAGMAVRAETATPCMAARVAATASTSGTGAAEAGLAATPATSASAGARPRRASRPSNRRRPRTSRLLTVPTGQRSRRAASSCESPSRAQSKIGKRWTSLSRSISSWTMAQSSSRSRRLSSSTAISPAPRRSRSLRRRTSPTARSATRRATRWSHPASASGSWIERARRASSRNVTWNASSARWPSASSWRQTRSTIDPWRSTRVANAASDVSPPRAN